MISHQVGEIEPRLFGYFPRVRANDLPRRIYQVQPPLHLYSEDHDYMIRVQISTERSRIGCPEETLMTIMMDIVVKRDIGRTKKTGTLMIATNIERRILEVEGITTKTTLVAEMIS